METLLRKCLGLLLALTFCHGSEFRDLCEEDKVKSLKKISETLGESEEEKVQSLKKISETLEESQNKLILTLNQQADLSHTLNQLQRRLDVIEKKVRL